MLGLKKQAQERSVDFFGEKIKAQLEDILTTSTEKKSERSSSTSSDNGSHWIYKVDYIDSNEGGQKSTPPANRKLERMQSEPTFKGNFSLNIQRILVPAVSPLAKPKLEKSSSIENIKPVTKEIPVTPSPKPAEKVSTCIPFWKMH